MIWLLLKGGGRCTEGEARGACVVVYASHTVEVLMGLLSAQIRRNLALLVSLFINFENYE